MFSYLLDVNLALLDMIWDAGYEFDSIHRIIRCRIR